jgi:hypothetical protein
MGYFTMYLPAEQLGGHLAYRISCVDRLIEVEEEQYAQAARPPGFSVAPAVVYRNWQPGRKRNPSTGCAIPTQCDWPGARWS